MFEIIITSIKEIINIIKSIIKYKITKKKIKIIKEIIEYQKNSEIYNKEIENYKERGNKCAELAQNGILKSQTGISILKSLKSSQNRKIIFIETEYNDKLLNLIKDNYLILLDENELNKIKDNEYNNMNILKNDRDFCLNEEEKYKENIRLHGRQSTDVTNQLSGKVYFNY